MKVRFFAKFFLLLLIFWLSSLSVLAYKPLYPQIDISGYKKWEYKRVDVNPYSNYFAALTQIGAFYPTFSGGPWQERLQLKITGQLSEPLSVSYNIEQQPEFPDRYDVKVKYYNTELTFGDTSANFSGNEFASAAKALNGVLVTSKDNWYDVVAVPSSKLKSQSQAIASQNGNNTRGPYNLGHGSIVEGSERIWLNNVPLTRNKDYIIDYFEGKINFTQILTTTDTFKYTYEYTNMLDLFFPSLSKRDFFGFQSRFNIDPETFGKTLEKPKPIILTTYEAFYVPISLVPSLETRAVYKLKNAPLTYFSERLWLGERLLRRAEDYLIFYDNGEIQLINKLVPSPEEPLMVEYQYQATSPESEFINGVDSPGPYKIKRVPIQPASESVRVDGKLLVKDLDYLIDYNKGTIIFAVNIGLTSQIQIDYNYYLFELPPPPSPIFKKELQVGATYLRESARAGGVASTATAIESFSGQTIVNNNYHIYLKNMPLVSTGEAFYLVVKVGGRTLTQEVDYSVPASILDPATGNYYTSPEARLAYVNDRKDSSDGYATGTLKLLNNSLVTTTSEVTVTYAYNKSVVGKYGGAGDGTRGPYYLRNIRNIVPGTEIVQVWDQGSSVITNYTRNTSFEANAGATGYAINYQANNPYLTFNSELAINKNFQVIYQYVPPTGSITDTDMAQSVMGVDGSFKIGNILKIEGAVARSGLDRYLVRQPTTESFTGNGNKNYILHAPQDIIEVSESVYINGLLLNKDIDYYFNYTKPGQITFFYLTPSTSDAIRVDYDYQDTDPSGGTVVTKAGNAFTFGAQANLYKDAVSLNGVMKKIDYDFTPMSGTSIPVGSEFQQYDLVLKPNLHSLSANYSYKENRDPLRGYSRYFLHTYDNNLTATVNPNQAAKVDFNYRRYQTIDDLLPGAATYANDVFQESFGLAITPTQFKHNEITFDQTYDLKSISAINDQRRDSNAYTKTNTPSLHGNWAFGYTPRFGLVCDYQQIEPKTVGLKASGSTSVEAVASSIRSEDLSYTLNLDITPQQWIQKWTARVSLANHVGTTYVSNFADTLEVSSLRNETYHSDFVPVSVLPMSFDHTRQEQLAKTVGQVNPKSQRTTTNISYLPFSYLSLNWNNAQTETIPETGFINHTTGNNNLYGLDYLIFAWPNFNFKTAFKLNNILQTAPSGTSSGEVATNTNTFSQDYSVTYTPVTVLPLSCGLTLENYRNYNNHPVVASRVDTETANRIVNLGLSWLASGTITLTSTYNLKVTSIIRDLALAPQDRQKSVFSNKLAYQVNKWSTASYERQQENNGGEVQGGSVIDFDYQKTSQILALNVNLPFDNQVITGFVFTASLKTVDYKNLKNSADNFLASLLSFEGTLNF